MYAQSHNRTLNTTRHIESSVGRLFSGDSCILVPRVNFSNKAPPTIKKHYLTNFSLGHPITSHNITRLSSTINHPSEPSRRQLFLGRQAISLHPLAFILSETPPAIVPCAAITKNCYGWGARLHFPAMVSASDSCTLDFICGHAGTTDNHPIASAYCRE
jgi:hypothetical protein